MLAAFTHRKVHMDLQPKNWNAHNSYLAQLSMFNTFSITFKPILQVFPKNICSIWACPQVTYCMVDKGLSKVWHTFIFLMDLTSERRKYIGHYICWTVNSSCRVEEHDVNEMLGQKAEMFLLFSTTNRIYRFESSTSSLPTCTEALWPHMGVSYNAERCPVLLELSRFLVAGDAHPHRMVPTPGGHGPAIRGAVVTYSLSTCTAVMDRETGVKLALALGATMDVLVRDPICWTGGIFNQT